jgi:hypothetical protein
MLAAPSAQPDSIGGTIPSDVLELCVRRGNLDHLQTAVRLASEHFKFIINVAFRVQIDPDSDEQRTIIDLTIDGEIDEVLASQRAFYRAWAQAVPPSQRDAIRLLPGFI